jgi:hypothetical protein
MLASPNSLWFNLLAFELIGEKRVGTSSTKSSKLWETAQRFMDGCLMADRVSFAESDGGQLMWNGSIVNSLGDHEHEEILWELAELSFRFELLALDTWVTTNPSNDCQVLIRACFPGGASGSLLVADLGTANHSLGNVSWEPRSVYLHALKKVMTTWKGEVLPIILARKIQWTEWEIDNSFQNPPNTADHMMLCGCGLFFSENHCAVSKIRLCHMNLIQLISKPPGITRKANIARRMAEQRRLR